MVFIQAIFRHNDINILFIGSSEKLFFEPIKKKKVQTMEANNKGVKLTSSQGKVCSFGDIIRT